MARIVRPADEDRDYDAEVDYWRWRLSMSREEYSQWWWSDVRQPPEGGAVSFEVARRRREVES
jgi:hypothetical protein